MPQRLAHGFNDIRDDSKGPLEGRRQLVDHVSVEADPRHAEEVATLDGGRFPRVSSRHRPGSLPERDPARTPVGKLLSGARGIVGQAQLFGDNVGRAAGQYPECRLARRKTVDDLVDGPVAATHQNQAFPPLGGVARHLLRHSRPGSLRKLHCNSRLA